MRWYDTYYGDLGGYRPPRFWSFFVSFAGSRVPGGHPKAQTEHLPIYKATYDLSLYPEQIVWHFSRYHKYALGADLRDGARRALKLVVRANARRDKTPVLLQLREELEALKVPLHLGQDVKAFANFKSFERTSLS